MEDINRFSFQDYLDYQDSVRKSLEDNDRTLFFNESFVHASIVTKAIVDKAVQEETPINMFCGKFSLFRENFKKHLNEIKEKLTYDPVVIKEPEKFEMFDPYNDLVRSLKAFFSKGLKLDVIIANTIDGIKKDALWPGLFESNINNGNLFFQKLNVPFEIDHFMVSGHAFRKETSGEAKTAICSINRKEYADILQDSFVNLKRYSTEIAF